jgi:hypothetical protein
MHINVGASRKAKEYRQRSNPLDDLTDSELYARFRFNRASLEFIFETFADDVRAQAKGGSLDAEVKILIAIQYFASNSFQLHIADRYGISQQTTSNYIKEVATAMSRRLEQFVFFPDLNERRKTMRRFSSIAQFPYTVGIVDGTQIPIQVKYYKIKFSSADVEI